MALERSRGWRFLGGRVSALLLAGLCLGALACKKKPEESVQAENDDSKPVALAISGYNYTDLYIESFSVAGVGGANIFVSGPELGGGGAVCCMNWYPHVPLPFPVKVKWTRDLKRWCEKEVMITGPAPAHPKYIVVHFFQDGRIEVELTEGFPVPKLRLVRFSPVQRKESSNTVMDERIARCRDGI